MKPLSKTSGLDALDALDGHRRAIETLAGLLAVCRRGLEIDGALIAEAGDMILDEAGAIGRCTRQIEEELRR